MKNYRKRDTLELGSMLFFMFGFSFLVNFLWEALHAVYLYQEHDFNASYYIRMLLYVSTVDGLIVLGMYLGVSIIWLNFFWIKAFMKKQLFVFTFIGIAVASIIEHLSVFHFRKWMYKENMPTIFDIGLSPLIQLSVTGLWAVWLTRELLYGKGLFRI
ncbi:MAG: hypothetical protein Q8O72_05590 [Bacteroidales bacterium]|nr:hypothetical protein [Bacteroidales bacterium]